jgi:hypothetical protein
MRRVTMESVLLADASADAEELARLPAGTSLLMLDNSRGWAWGYAGEQQLVGYVPAAAVGV